MPDQQITYSILRRIVYERTNDRTRTYGELSRLYHARTGEHFSPHGTWDMVLDGINKRLEAAGLPPLSAVIVNQETQMPGGGFWGSCLRTANPPRSSADKQLEYIAILHDVYAATWPTTLP